MPKIFEYRMTIPPEALDQNNHVNNVEYLRWMVRAAVQHSHDEGATAAARAEGATWFVRSHHIEYKRPAFAGEDILIRTWVSDVRRTSSLRKYRILRAEDEQVLAEAETIWVFVDAKSGRPRPIPAAVADRFQVVPPEQEP